MKSMNNFFLLSNWSTPEDFILYVFCIFYLFFFIMLLESSIDAIVDAVQFNFYLKMIKACYKNLKVLY